MWARRGQHILSAVGTGQGGRLSGHPPQSQAGRIRGALTPHLQHLPGEEDKRAFMEELVTRYLALMPSTQNNAGHTTYT